MFESFERTMLIAIIPMRYNGLIIISALSPVSAEKKNTNEKNDETMKLIMTVTESKMPQLLKSRSVLSFLIVFLADRARTKRGMSAPATNKAPKMKPAILESDIAMLTLLPERIPYASGARKMNAHEAICISLDTANRIRARLSFCLSSELREIMCSAITAIM